MTEAEWLSCEDVAAMLTAASASERKRRLFRAACARLLWDRLEHEVFRHAIEASERYADSPKLRIDLDVAYYRTGSAMSKYHVHDDHGPAAFAASFAVLASSLHQSDEPGFLDVVANVEVAPALLRDVVGNPFRAVSIDPIWMTWESGTIPRLALAAYKERLLPMGHLDAVLLAVLADALEDAGCADEAILTHLRSPGPHVRGCWAVDLILGRT